MTGGYNAAKNDSNASFECLSINYVGKASSGFSGRTYIDNTFMSAIGGDTQFPANPEPDDPEQSEPSSDYYGKGAYYNDTAYSDDVKYSYDGLEAITKDDLLTSDSTYDSITVKDDTLRVKNRDFAIKNGGEKNGTSYVFETDLYLENASEIVASVDDPTIAWIGMSSAEAKTSKHFASFAIKYEADESGNITGVYVVETSRPDSVIYAELKLGAWQNIRIEYTPSEDSAEGNYNGTVRFYLNGVLSLEYVTNGYGNNKSKSNAVFECFGICVRQSSSSGYSGALFFDNTFMSAITEE